MNDWAGTNGVEVIREYRKMLTTCGSACTAARLTAAATSPAWTSTMLAAGFTRTNTAGTFNA